jgi:hypothetical protein
MPQPGTAACHKNVTEPSSVRNRNGGFGPARAKMRPAPDRHDCTGRAAMPSMNRSMIALHSQLALRATRKFNVALGRSLHRARAAGHHLASREGPVNPVEPPRRQGRGDTEYRGRG